MAVAFTACSNNRSVDIHHIYDEIIVNTEWPQMDMITDEYILSTRFLIEDTSQYEDILVMQCPASAVRSEIILIRTEDVSSACAPSRGSGEPFPHLFQLLVAPGDSWLVAASLLFCLHLCRAYPHLSVSLFCMFLTRIAVIG